MTLVTSVLVVLLLVVSQIVVGVSCCTFADSAYASSTPEAIHTVDGLHDDGHDHASHNAPIQGAFDHCLSWVDSHPFLLPQQALPSPFVELPVWQAYVLAWPAAQQRLDPPALRPPIVVSVFYPPLYRLHARLLL